MSGKRLNLAVTHSGGSMHPKRSGQSVADAFRNA
jgi:hypothetical protein